MFDVVMPLYNKEEFVRATIEAVLAQSFADWRLIVVDDGSSDGGAQIVRSFRDPRVSLIEQENQGVGPARNTGIREGAGAWIAFLDADDVWNADHLAELDALRREYPHAALIGCAFARFNGVIRPRIESDAGERRLARYFRECADGRELLVTSSAAVRRKAIDGAAAFEDLPGNEDVELWARLALCAPVAVSSRATVNYRVDSGGITEKGMGREVDSKPTRREDLSSTIPTLERALPRVRDEWVREDIIAYIDSRIGIRMTKAVLDGDIDYARQLRRLYRGKPAGKAATAATIVRFPKPLGQSLMSIRRRIKGLSR